MTRAVALAITVLGVAAGGTAVGQEPLPTDPAPDRHALEHLIETLESPASRDRFVADLKAALAALQEPAPTGEAAGASAMRALADGVARVGEQFLLLAETLTGIPKAVVWLVEHAGEAGGSGAWLAAAGNLLAIVATGVLAGAIAARVLAAARRRVGQQAPSAWLRPPLLLYHTLLRLVPNLVAAGAGYGVLSVADPGPTAGVVGLAVVSAHLLASILKAAGVLVLAPDTPGLRLALIRNEDAVYCAIWWRRLVSIGVYGYVFCEAGLLIGLPPAGHAALMHLLGLVLAGLLTALILQNRTPLALRLRAAREAPAPRWFLGIRALPGWLADYWHVPAIAYIVAGGLLVAVDGLDGLLFLAKGTAGTIVVAWATGIGMAGARRIFEQGFRIPADLDARYPGLQTRTTRYLPLARGLVQAVLLLLGAGLVSAAWNVDIFAWLAGPAGAAVTSATASIVTILIVAVVVLEVLSATVDRYLTAVDAAGERLERSQRARTLLPLARSALRIVVGVIAALMIFSEIGIDIAPVLAGVGVVGLAVGFGAQTLVQDIITGLFMLIEDSVAVGDVVTAGGHTGVVEEMTIRTIRLRDLQGQVHTIPFSAVGPVSNLTREYAYYVIDMGVAYRENYDEVVAVMREVSEELRQDPEFGPDVLEPLEVMGLQSFGDSAVVIRARLKTAPSRQWSTGREYNRRLKAAFDARGIEIPFPHTTLYFGEDKHGHAPAGRVMLNDTRRPAEPPDNSTP